MLNLEWAAGDLEQRFPTAGARPGTGTWSRSRWDQEKMQFNKPGFQLR